jgi:hypothetical protein
MGWSWLWWRRGPGRPACEVVLYTRAGCHLCEDALGVLRRARRRYPFLLRQVDIDADEELTRLYGLCVPVVTVGGRVRFRGAVNPVLLERELRGRC